MIWWLIDLLSQRAIRPDQALLLRARDLMGQTSQEVTPRGVIELPTGAGEATPYEVTPARRQAARENVFESDQLVFRFPGVSVDAEGWLVLMLEIMHAPPPPPGEDGPAHHFTVQSVALTSAGDGVCAALRILPGVEFRYRWGYSRHAGMRLVCEPSHDRPEGSSRRWAYHVTWLSADARPSPSGAVGDGAGAIEIELPAREAGEISAIDRCERVLDELDDHFGAGDGSLRWRASEVTHEALGRAITSLSGGAPSVAFRTSEGEWTWGKNVRPTIQFPVTLTRPDGDDAWATIGVSVNEPQ